MSEQALRILLQLVDQATGPAQGISSALGDTGKAAGEAAEAIADVGEQAQSAGDKAKKSPLISGEATQKLTELRSGLAMVRQAWQTLMQVAEEYNALLERQIEAGNKSAIAVKENQDLIQRQLEKTQGRYEELIVKQSEQVQWARLGGEAAREHLQAQADLERQLTTLGEAFGNAGAAARDNLAAAMPTLAEKMSDVAQTNLPEYIAGLIKPVEDSGKVAAIAAGSYDAYRQALQETRDAADDLKQSMLDGQTAIMEFGLKFDEAITEPQTVESAVGLAQGLADAALEAQNLGRDVPTSQVQGLRDDAAKLTDALAGMSLTEEQRNILLGWLDLANQRLAEAERNARLARDAMAGMGGPPPGSGYAGPGGAGAAPIEMQHGGTIAEPIVGRGLLSGRRYHLGEGGTVEDVVPRGAGAAQIIQLVVDGRVLAEVVAAATEKYR